VRASSSERRSRSQAHHAAADYDDRRSAHRNASSDLARRIFRTHCTTRVSQQATCQMARLTSVRATPILSVANGQRGVSWATRSAPHEEAESEVRELR